MRFFHPNHQWWLPIPVKYTLFDVGGVVHRTEPGRGVDSVTPKPRGCSLSVQKVWGEHKFLVPSLYNVIATTVSWKLLYYKGSCIDIWSVQPNDRVQKYKKYKNTKEKSTKIQKRKNANIQKMQKMEQCKNVKAYKSTK